MEYGILQPLPPNILGEWLETLKTRLAISGNYQDEILVEYIAIAHRNIWTQYYNLELDEHNIVPAENEWAYDFVTKQGTLHLAALYFSNPTETTETKNTIVDQRMLYKILGNRVFYG
ncbi:phage head-tail connector protein [Mycoplasma seminis]|uniref:Phage head-tail connector protein n=1 Tax=Mycoplasma seminis TaxID=512749 RepID=A0ABY9HAR9_9MOLU|nr:phage head-tail connector protein [Mycoplasma seminis]WLP85289.1 phage head-tail connector protein [Mycoplasma seminis]